MLTAKAIAAMRAEGIGDLLIGGASRRTRACGPAGAHGGRGGIRLRRPSRTMHRQRRDDRSRRRRGDDCRLRPSSLDIGVNSGLPVSTVVVDAGHQKLALHADPRRPRLHHVGRPGADDPPAGTARRPPPRQVQRPGRQIGPARSWPRPCGRYARRPVSTSYNHVCGGPSRGGFGSDGEDWFGFVFTADRWIEEVGPPTTRAFSVGPCRVSFRPPAVAGRPPLPAPRLRPSVQQFMASCLIETGFPSAGRSPSLVTFKSPTPNSTAETHSESLHILKPADLERGLGFRRMSRAPVCCWGAARSVGK